MPKFRNVADAVHVYRPEGDADSLPVDSGQVIDVPGDLGPELPDAYVVGAADDARLWPKARWALVKEKSASASAPVKES